MERDNQLVLALEDEGTLLEDEPVGEWAVRPLTTPGGGPGLGGVPVP
jgi:hypothetical protein